MSAIESAFGIILTVLSGLLYVTVLEFSPASVGCKILVGEKPRSYSTSDTLELDCQMLKAVWMQSEYLSLTLPMSIQELY